MEKPAATPAAPAKPIVVLTALPCVGHTEPLIRIAEHLVLRGFDVHFLAGPAFQARIEAAGARWYNNPRVQTDRIREAIDATPVGWRRLYKQLVTSWIYGARERHYRLRILLEHVRQLHPDREVVIVTEPMCTGVIPFYYGAPLPHGYTSVPKVINIHVFPIWLTSADTAPFGLGWAHKEGKLGRLRNRLMNFAAKPIYAYANHLTNQVYQSLGATKKVDEWILDVMLKSYDITFTPTVPSLEYPRRDLPSHIQFIGCWPAKAISPTYRLPPAWSRILANHELSDSEPSKKKLAVVCQGTIAVDYNNVVVPTIEAVRNRHNVLLLVILGVRGATLPARLAIPPNVVVVDYMPYDAAFPLSDFIVCNAGWGGFHHAVSVGVPMIVAGNTEDKKEVSMRGQRAGNAINLRTAKPSAKKVGLAVDEMLGNGKYKERALELKRESDLLEPLGPLGRIEAQILEFGAVSDTEAKERMGGEAEATEVSQRSSGQTL